MGMLAFLWMENTDEVCMLAFLWMENADEVWVCWHFCGWRLLIMCGYVGISVDGEC